jgi:hypothetical protein
MGVATLMGLDDPLLVRVAGYLDGDFLNLSHVNSRLYNILGFVPSLWKLKYLRDNYTTTPALEARSVSRDKFYHPGGMFHTGNCSFIPGYEISDTILKMSTNHFHTWSQSNDF